MVDPVNNHVSQVITVPAHGCCVIGPDTIGKGDEGEAAFRIGPEGSPCVACMPEGETWSELLADDVGITGRKGVPPEGTGVVVGEIVRGCGEEVYCLWFEELLGGSICCFILTLVKHHGNEFYEVTMISENASISTYSAKNPGCRVMNYTSNDLISIVGNI